MRQAARTAFVVIGYMLTAIGTSGCAGSEHRSDTSLPALTIESVATPAPPESGSVQLMSAASRTMLSWIERAGDRQTLKFSERKDSRWSDAQVVVVGERLMVNSADFPSVSALANGLLVAQWLEENGPNPEAYDLRVSVSSDGGQTWTAATSPHHDGTPSQHGFASVFELPARGFGLLWLDGRNAVGGLLGDVALRAAEYNYAGQQLSETVVDDRVCECCQSAAAPTTTGIVAAYRDRSPDEIRDISIVRRDDSAWLAPTRLHDDGWKIHGCPVNGPAIDARGADVVVTWFAVLDEVGHVFAAFSADSGQHFGELIRIDDAASAGRPQAVLLDDGTAVVSWSESVVGAQTFRARRVNAKGQRGPSVTVAGHAGRESLRMARGQGELLFGWVERDAGVTRLQMARVPL